MQIHPWGQIQVSGSKMLTLGEEEGGTREHGLAGRCLGLLAFPLPHRDTLFCILSSLSAILQSSLMPLNPTPPNLGEHQRPRGSGWARLEPLPPSSYLPTCPAQLKIASPLAGPERMAPESGG